MKLLALLEKYAEDNSDYFAISQDHRANCICMNCTTVAGLNELEYWYYDDNDWINTKASEVGDRLTNETCEEIIKMVRDMRY